MSESPVHDLLAYIDASPSPFHAVLETQRRLEAAGFARLDERDAWELAPGARAYLVRDGGSIAAFEVGTHPPEEAGVRLIGAHTDSPTLRIKPQPELSREGYRQLAVEVYGGALYSTWLDRDLSIAGRVVLAGEGTQVQSHMVRLDDLVLRVPNLAIHLNRGVNDSLQLNAQQHLVPVVGLGDRSGFSLRDRLVRTLAHDGLPNVAPERVLGWDLSLFGVEPSRLGGLENELIFAPRLDNLSSCHAALSALIASAGPKPQTRVVVLFDHEEVGSQSARGAGSLMLRALLSRLLEVFGPASETRLTRAVARSLLVSGDMAHGVHPNYADRHEPGHRPLLGQGPVIKLNSNQGYGTDGETWALIEQLAASVQTKLQRFVVRSDLGCGSTIGPISAARLGIRTVDIGNPMLSMHSAREMAAVADVAPMLRLLGAFLAAA
ncbi:MAG: putative aminopeptidase 2 [Myxococcaceae bacterium]|nr:putative aminopeptidase 2 [Myxococcaceae bacterium]